ncbi:SAM-dependent methyltransferase [Candidatus Methylocalor cossyra]|uniref:SAM-dependent methyltransferase n=2 Tax=Candidatus Methylocalor cossyra TaxID=3108543 RepID=A0ABP1CBE5_9GAMM
MLDSTAMTPAEFDQFADAYRTLHHQNIRFSGESPEFFAEYKVKDAWELLWKQGKSATWILDFGAGIGTSVAPFRKYFPRASLTCLDVSEKSLAVGRARYPDLAEFRAFDGKRIPFPENTFDLIFAAGVFHHIPHGEHLDLLREWRRVLRPGGTALLFEHNPFNPITRHAVNTCPFDDNAHLIYPSELRRRLREAGFEQIGLRYRLFVPGFLRFLRPLERWLSACPLGAQYFVHGVKIAP